MLSRSLVHELFARKMCPSLTWVIWANGVGVFSRFSKVRELLMLENKLEKLRQERFKMIIKKRTSKRNKNNSVSKAKCRKMSQS